MDAVYLENGTIRFEASFPKPSVGSHQVLIKISLAGICATDLALLSGYANFSGIPGHEFVGTVVETGEQVDSSWLNQRVVAEINQFCGQCPACEAKRFSHCYHRKVVGIREHQGAFAQFLVVNANTLHRIPDTMDEREAVFIEPLAAAYRIVAQLADVAYDNVLIIGAGKLGQLIARVMAQYSHEVVVVTRRKRQAESLQTFPVRCLSESEVIDQAWDVVIEASGQRVGFTRALKAVRPCGHIVLKSTYTEPIDWPLSELVINEITLLGSRCGSFTQAIQAINSNQLGLSSLIDAEYPLNAIEKAIEHASQPGTMKILLRP